MTPELFMQWKKKKIEERDAGLAAQMAERAKNDRMRYLSLFSLHQCLYVLINGCLCSISACFVYMYLNHFCFAVGVSFSSRTLACLWMMWRPMTNTKQKNQMLLERR